MTEEEIVIAEEWVGENGFSSDCNNINSVEANREMVNAFLAGLKSQTKWHKVADGNLPKESSKTKLYAVWFGDNDYSVVQFARGKFRSFICGRLGFDEVIAWCEIPSFDKE